VAGAVGLAVGSFFIRDAEGVSGFHAGLVGDWEAVLLPGQAPPADGAGQPDGPASSSASTRECAAFASQICALKDFAPHPSIRLLAAASCLMSSHSPLEYLST